MYAYTQYAGCRCVVVELIVRGGDAGEQESRREDEAIYAHSRIFVHGISCPSTKERQRSTATPPPPSLPLDPVPCARRYVYIIRVPPPPTRLFYIQLLLLLLLGCIYERRLKTASNFPRIHQSPFSETDPLEAMQLFETALEKRERLGAEASLLLESELGLLLLRAGKVAEAKAVVEKGKAAVDDLQVCVVCVRARGASTRGRPRVRHNRTRGPYDPHSVRSSRRQPRKFSFAVLSKRSYVLSCVSCRWRLLSPLVVARVSAWGFCGCCSTAVVCVCRLFKL